MDALNDLRARYRSLAPRERLLVTLAAAALALVLVDRLAVQPLLAARENDRRAVAHDRRLLAWMERVAAKVEALRTQAVHPAAATTPLTLLAQETLAGHGLSASKIASGGRGSVKVVFASVPFSRLVLWIHDFSLESGARVRAFTAHRLRGQPGLVSASVSLKRSPPS